MYDEKNDGVKFVGSRYMLDNKLLPAFKPWIEANVGIDFKIKEDPQPDMECPAPIVNTQFLDELGTETISRRSFLKWERIMHSHGHTF